MRKLNKNEKRICHSKSDKLILNKRTECFLWKYSGHSLVSKLITVIINHCYFEFLVLKFQPPKCYWFFLIFFPISVSLFLQSSFFQCRNQSFLGLTGVYSYCVLEWNEEVGRVTWKKQTKSIRFLTHFFDISLLISTLTRYIAVRLV